MRPCLLACFLLGGAITVVRPTIGRAEEAAAAIDPSADEKAIREAGAAYRAAFAKGDVEAVAAFWTKNADLVDQAGHAFKVQAVLEPPQDGGRRGQYPAADSQK